MTTRVFGAVSPRAAEVFLSNGVSVEQAISNGVVSTFGTLQDLKSSGVTQGQIVATQGYFLEGDGGANLYRIVASGTGTADGGSIVNLNSGLQAEGLFPFSVVSVKQFGAVGDDSSNNQAVFQFALDYLAKICKDDFNAYRLFIPAGTYRFNGKVVCQVAVSGTPNEGTDGIVIEGEGPQATYLVANASNTAGIIQCTSDKNSELWTVRGIGFLSDLDKDAATNNGIALEINSTLTRNDAGWGLQPRRTVRVENCYFGGYGTTSGDRAFRGNFNKAVYIANKWWPYVSDLYIRGSDIPFDGTTNNPLYTLTGRTHAIHFHDCYSPEVNDTQVTGYYLNGVLIEGRENGEPGQDMEDFRVHDCFFVNQDRGISVLHSSDQETLPLYEPGGSVANCHIFSHTYGFHLRYHRQVILTGNYVYVPRGFGLPDYTGNPAGVYLEGTSDVIINGCSFLEPGFYSTDSNASCGIRMSTRTYSTISSCHFNHGGIGVLTDSGTNGVVVLSNSTYFGNTDSQWAAFNRVVDNASIVAEILVNNDPVGDKSTLEVSNKYTGSTAGPRIALYSDRSDFSTNSNAQLGLIRYEGNTSTGNRKEAFTLRGEWTDNTEGTEDSEFTAFQRRNGSLVPAFNVNPQGIFTCQGYATQGLFGATNSFTTADGKTVTVTAGIITSVV